MNPPSETEPYPTSTSELGYTRARLASKVQDTMEQMRKELEQSFQQNLQRSIGMGIQQAVGNLQSANLYSPGSSRYPRYHQSPSTTQFSPSYYPHTHPNTVHIHTTPLPPFNLTPQNTTPYTHPPQTVYQQHTQTSPTIYHQTTQTENPYYPELPPPFPPPTPFITTTPQSTTPYYPPMYPPNYYPEQSFSPHYQPQYPHTSYPYYQEQLSYTSYTPTYYPEYHHDSEPTSSSNMLLVRESPELESPMNPLKEDIEEGSMEEFEQNRADFDSIAFSEVSSPLTVQIGESPQPQISSEPLHITPPISLELLPQVSLSVQPSIATIRPKKLMVKIPEIPDTLYAHKVFDLSPHPTASHYNKLIQAYSSHDPYHYCFSIKFPPPRPPLKSPDIAQIGKPPPVRQFPIVFHSGRIILVHGSISEVEKFRALVVQKSLEIISLEGDIDELQQQNTAKILVPSSKVCAAIVSVRDGEVMHGRAVKYGFESDLFVRNSLILMYSICGRIFEARKVFDASPESDLVTWNSMIDGYARIGNVWATREVFDRMPLRNVVSWNSMLALYIRGKKYSECLKLFDGMLEGGEAKPNVASLVSVLTACASLGKLERGQWVNSDPLPGYHEGQFLKRKVLEISRSAKGTVQVDLSLCTILDGLNCQKSGGLSNNGGVHSRLNQVQLLLKGASEHGAKRIRLHILADGRDVLNGSSVGYVETLEKDLEELRAKFVDAQIASGGGRTYVTMDRYENDWSVVKRGWDAQVLGDAPYKFRSALEAVKKLREDKKVNNQYLSHFVIVDENGKVGHTGEIEATVVVCKATDKAVRMILNAIEQVADQGNDEDMHDALALLAEIKLQGLKPNAVTLKMTSMGKSIAIVKDIRAMGKNCKSQAVRHLTHSPSWSWWLIMKASLFKGFHEDMHLWCKLGSFFLESKLEDKLDLKRARMMRPG